MKKIFLHHGRPVLLAVMMGFFITVSAQDGPGGVGSTNGTSHLKLWLRTDKGTFTDAGVTATANGQPVLQWNDQSGNGINAIQSTAGSRPVFTTTGFNGLPAVSFTGGSKFLNAAINISPSVNPKLTIITVASFTTLPNGPAPYAKLWGHDNGGYNRCVGLDPRAVPGPFCYFTGTSVANFPFNTTLPDADAPFISTAIYTPTTFTGYLQGIGGGTAGAVSSSNGRPQFTIGAINTLGSEPWSGNIVEMLVYDTTLSISQTTNIENYLSAKYGTAVQGADIYRMDRTDQGNFDYDVVGLQNHVGDPLIVNTAKGTGIVTLSNPSNLSAGSSYFIGHDNGSLSLVTTALPAGIANRLGRTWAGTENNGDIGTLNLSFDLPQLVVSDPANLRLLIDRNSDGNFSDETDGNGIVSGFTRSGSTYTVNANMDDGQRFTIGVASAATLPVNLRSMFVTKDGQYNKLQWKTNRETGFAYFEVQRSEDGTNFYILGTVQASKSTSAMKEYSFTDNTPPAAGYYRLRMVDQKGEFTYSSVLKMIQTNKRFTISPNPATNIVSVTGLDGSAATIQLIDPNGRLLEEVKTTGLQHSFYLTKYPKGTYHIKVSTTKESFTETIIKQ